MRASLLQYLKSTTPQECAVDKILECIRTNPNAQEILKARRYQKKHPEYNKVKFSVPSWMPHGIFGDGANDADLIQLSNFIYFDLDQVEDVKKIKTELKQFPYVYAAWRSFGGNGLGFLVNVEGVVDKETLKDAWNQIAMEIDMPFDTQAKSLSRKNVLSYDPEIWINQHSSPFIYKKKKHSNIKDKMRRTLAVYPLRREEQYVANVHPDTPLKVHSLIPQDEFESKPYLYFEEGKDYCDIFIANAEIPNGRRRIGLLSITSKLIYLNPGHQKSKIKEFVLSINEAYCKPPMPDRDVDSLFNFLWEQFESNLLQVAIRKRYLWFNREVHMDKSERGRICQKVSATRRKANTKKKVLTGYWKIVDESIEINYTNLAFASGVNDKTIRRRKDEFQHLIDNQNRFILMSQAGLLESFLFDFEYDFPKDYALAS